MTAVQADFFLLAVGSGSRAYRRYRYSLLSLAGLTTGAASVAAAALAATMMGGTIAVDLCCPPQAVRLQGSGE